MARVHMGCKADRGGCLEDAGVIWGMRAASGKLPPPVGGGWGNAVGIRDSGAEMFAMPMSGRALRANPTYDEDFRELGVTDQKPLQVLLYGCRYGF